MHFQKKAESDIQVVGSSIESLKKLKKNQEKSHKRVYIQTSWQEEQRKIIHY